jgi:ligand-binding SRPBCC domain-containing protein
MYKFSTKQQLPISIETAWDFFSDPSNLQIITPANMGFIITAGFSKGDKMVAGMQISYKIKPVLGIPLTWVSLISKVDAPFCFTDKQVEGPYSYWRHQHFFKEIPGGIEMEDVVSYDIPLGRIGRLANSMFVGRMLKSIFNYRYTILEKRFGRMKEGFVFA